MDIFNGKKERKHTKCAYSVPSTVPGAVKYVNLLGKLFMELTEKSISLHITCDQVPVMALEGHNVCVLSRV